MSYLPAMVEVDPMGAPFAVSQSRSVLPLLHAADVLPLGPKHTSFTDALLKDTKSVLENGWKVFYSTGRGVPMPPQCR